MSDQNQYDDDLDTFDDGVDAGDSWESFDDDTDISDDELAAVGGESKKKKKSGPVSLLLIIAVLLGGGAFAYTQFSGAPTTPLSSAGEDAFADESSSMPPMPSAISAPPMAEAGDDVAGFALADEPAQDLNLAPAPAPAPVLEPMEQAISPRFTGEETQASRLPSADDLRLRPALTDTPQPSASSDSADTALDSPSFAPESRPATQSSPAVGEDVALLSGRLEQIENDIAALRSASADLLDLKENLVRLERSLEALKTARPAAAPVKMSTEKAEPIPAQRPKPQILGATETQPQAAVRTSTETAVRWVLRGAQPGQAMVARAGDSDVQTVRVGDSLPGIGRITEIVYIDGRWKVRGTSGDINQ